MFVANVMFPHSSYNVVKQTIITLDITSLNHSYRFVGDGDLFIFFFKCILRSLYFSHYLKNKHTFFEWDF